jgi:hypothetical protein
MDKKLFSCNEKPGRDLYSAELARLQLNFADFITALWEQALRTNNRDMLLTLRNAYVEIYG